MFRFLARLMLSAVFLASTTNAIKNAGRMAGAAESLGLPEPVKMVQLHGVGNLVGGAMLALGIKPRLAAFALIANLIPTTVAGHPFWEADDEDEKMGQQIHFMKNVGLLGGLLAVMVMEGKTKEADA